MNRALGILLLILVASALVGCAEKDEPEAAIEVANPVHESTAVEILGTLGITFHIAEDAVHVSYSTIESSDGSDMAQVKFTRKNVEYTYRIQSKPMFEDISGAYYEWTTVKRVEVNYCSGELRFNDDKEGICLWYDTVPGLMYSLYTEEGATEETLISLANDLFVPAKDAP